MTGKFHEALVEGCGTETGFAGVPHGRRAPPDQTS
jgi:hypothetical protein